MVQRKHVISIVIVVEYWYPPCLCAPKCLSVFSMRSTQLLCALEYLLCIPDAVLWDCCSFNYSLILKDQRSLPQSTPCI